MEIGKLNTMTRHYSFLMSQKSSCFAAAWDLAPCPHSQCLFRYVLLMPTKFSCLAAAWDLAPCPHFHYLPNDLLHHQAGDRKGKVSNFRWLRDRKIGSGILSSSGGAGAWDPGWGLAFMSLIHSNLPKPSPSPGGLSWREWFEKQHL